MAWDEWEQLKAQAAQGQSARMQLNQLDGGGGYTPDPSSYGDLKANQSDLSNIGQKAFTLYNDLWNNGRRAVPTSETAAATLSKDGFALGGALKHVATRWDEQLSSLRDACAHISNHMTVTKKLHAEDDHYIRRQMSSIDLLDAGFDERVGDPGKKNPVYGDSGEKKDKN
ncbi:hypothetical protein [Streptomyces sp. NL15-2K]|uniref:hypothetical protein n=1 Tax=Streptomyces sp. NL15-2K TaxID=376149 RepID=UPI000F571AF7|nr:MULTISPECIES: hypothetical protein [Actinomycetes]WKX13084.1 hypothetical protein Q4V64_38390 [Kutzneria buriramensis]GCB45589.1 hypothetical protein SNL152K_2880 [Streptomyces sp. NL15-2K]